MQPTLVLAILATLGIGIGSQVYRYRKVSNPFERQQTKWVMAAMVVVAVVLIISIVTRISSGPNRPWLPR